MNEVRGTADQYDTSQYSQKVKEATVLMQWCVPANGTQLHVKWSDLGMGMCLILSYGWCACGVGCVVDHRKMDRGGG